MDKNKIIEAAAKLVAKGAYDKAIKEYQKILDVDPKDVRILQKMGELYQKKSDNSQAAAYFTKVAESYTADGFFLKAVALYKQVLKLDPTLVEVNLKLAELHQQLQLLGEAMAYFQIVANHYDKAGDAKRSLDVLRKMVDLDPDNVPSRRKLADLYVREGLQAEGAAEYRKAAEHLKRQNRTDDYLQVAERLSALEPDNLGLARELAELYLQRNDQKRALAKLQVCFKADSRDIDTLRLLAVAFQGLGQISKTISVHKELAKAYEEKGLNREAEQTWAQVSQLDPNDPDVVARRQAVAPPPVTSAAPAHVPARPAPQAQPVPSAPIPVPMAAPPVAAKPKGDNLGKLLTETDVYVKYGLHDKALEHLRKVFAIDPENIDAHEKAYAIYVASNNQAQASEQLLNVLRLHTMRGDAVRAQPYLATMLQQNPGHAEVPAFLQVLRVQGAAGMAPSHGDAEVAEDAILVDSADDEVIVADDPHEELVSGDEALADEPALEAEPLLAPEDAAAAAAYEFEPPPVPEGDDSPAQVVSDFPDEPLGAEDSATGEHLASAEPLPEDVAAAGMADEPFSQTQDTDIPVQPAPASTLDQDEALVPDEPFEAPAEPFERPSLGDDEHERPTGVSPRFDPEAWRTASAAALPEESFADLGDEAPPPALIAPEAPDLEPLPPEPGTANDAPPEQFLAPETTSEYATEPPAEPAEVAPEVVAAEEPVQAPPEDDAAAEECDEATFFLEQGLFEEAREILETVLIAFGDHPRATELMAQLEAAVAAASETPAEAPPADRFCRRGPRRLRPRAGAGGTSWATSQEPAPAKRPRRRRATTTRCRSRRSSPSSRRASRRSSSPRTWTRTTISASPTRRWASSTTPSASSRWRARAAWASARRSTASR